MGSAVVSGPVDTFEFFALNDIQGGVRFDGDTSASAQITVSCESASDAVVQAWCDNYTAGQQRYLIASDAPVLQPYLTASYASGTLTVALHSPPSAPPTEATVTVGSSTQTVALASNTGTLTLAVHASVAAYSLPVEMAATGCVSASLDLGTPGHACPVALQVYTPPGGSLTVGPTGAGSKAFLRAWALGLTEATQAEILTEALQDLMTATTPVAHILVTKIIPALAAATYAPITLSAQEQAALATWQSGLAPNLTTLAGTTDASGNPGVQLAETIAAAPTFVSQAQAYATAASEIPNLA